MKPPDDAAQQEVTSQKRILANLTIYSVFMACISKL
jgi:hypothetical protein